MLAAKAMHEVLLKLAGLEKAHQEYHKISLYHEVFKKADLLKFVPDVILKELKKGTNINFETDI